MHLNYVVIPICAIIVASLGSRFTRRAVDTWYRDIQKPSWTPPGSIIGAVWTVLYILATLSALTVWNETVHDTVFVWIMAVFAVNGLVNIYWSYLFFARKRLYAAIWDCLLLDVTILILIDLIASRSTLASTLLIPYGAWVTFAAYLNYRVWSLNKRLASVTD